MDHDAIATFAVCALSGSPADAAFYACQTILARASQAPIAPVSCGPDERADVIARNSTLHPLRDAGGRRAVIRALSKYPHDDGVQSACGRALAVFPTVVARQDVSMHLMAACVVALCIAYATAMRASPQRSRPMPPKPTLSAVKKTITPRSPRTPRDAGSLSGPLTRSQALLLFASSNERESP